MVPCTITREYGVTWLDGRPYIGITKLLAAAGTSDNLVKWKVGLALDNYDKLLAQFEAGEISEEEFKRKRSVWNLTQTTREKMQEGGSTGRDNHSMLQAFAEGDSEKMQEHKQRSPAAYSALDLWLVENSASIELSEVDVFHGQLGACGRFDALIRTPKGQGIYELKSKDRVFHEAIMQASFYLLCDVRVAGGLKDTHHADYASVLLLKDGKCVEQPIHTPPERIKTLMAYRTIFEELNPNSPIFKASKEAA